MSTHQPLTPLHRPSALLLILGALLLGFISGCSTTSRYYAQPTVRQPHATLLYKGLNSYQLNLPSVRLVEVNGKPPILASGYMKRESALRLFPGPVHLFVEGNTGLGVSATAHLDFVAHASSTYHLDQVIGLREIAFVLTESGRTVATASGSKAAASPPQVNSTPMFIPIMVR